MDIRKITFPLYKIRSYLNIETNPIGLVKITTVKDTYILDDTSINGTFEERRALLHLHYPTKKVYNLKEQVLYLRQLVKYKSGTTFIDYNGNIVKYNKSSKLFDVKSYKLTRKIRRDNWTVISLENFEHSFIVGKTLTPEAKFASIMYTTWGPFLYDITSVKHEPYKRKI